MKRTYLVGVIAMCASFIFASCSSTTSTNTPNNGTNNTPANTMVITVSGKTYTIPVIAHKQTSSGQTTISVVGADSTGTGSGFTLTNITTTGSYDVGTIKLSGTTVQTIVMIYTTKDGSGNSVTYQSPNTPGSSVGNVTIQQLDATTIKATFNGTLTINGSGMETPVILSGGSVNATIN